MRVGESSAKNRAREVVRKPLDQAPNHREVGASGLRVDRDKATPFNQPGSDEVAEVRNVSEPEGMDAPSSRRTPRAIRNIGHELAPTRARVHNSALETLPDIHGRRMP